MVYIQRKTVFHGLTAMLFNIFQNFQNQQSEVLCDNLTISKSHTVLLPLLTTKMSEKTLILFWKALSVSLNILIEHSLKSVLIQSFSGPYFHTFGLNTDIYSVNLSVFSPNAGKCGQEKLWIRTLITQWENLVKILLLQRNLKCLEKNHNWDIKLLWKHIYSGQQWKIEISALSWFSSHRRV